MVEITKSGSDEENVEDERNTPSTSRDCSKRKPLSECHRKRFSGNCPGSAPSKLSNGMSKSLAGLDLNSSKTPEKRSKIQTKLSRSLSNNTEKRKVESDAEIDTKQMNPAQFQKMQLRNVVEMELLDNGYPKNINSPATRKFFTIEEYQRVEATSGQFHPDADKKCVICHKGCSSDDDEELISCYGNIEGVSKKIPCRSKFHKKCAIMYNSNAFLFQYAARVECQNKLLCPLHCCVACNVNHKKQSAYVGPLTECALCLRSFHTESCLPAGSKPLDVEVDIGEKTIKVEMMICPAHNVADRPSSHIKACRDCRKTDDLIQCATCVRSFHVECQDVSTIDGKPNPMDRCEMCLCQDVIRYNVPVIVRWEKKWWLATTRDWNSYPSKERQKANRFESVGYTVVEWPSKGNDEKEMSIVPVNELADLVLSYIRRPTVKSLKVKNQWKEVLAEFDPFKDIPLVLKEVNRVMITSKCSKRFTYRSFETDVCKCTGDNRCTSDDCIYVYFECECPPECSQDGRICHNRKISERFQNKDIECRVAGTKGFGLFATAEIKKHDYIAEYVGEVIDSAERERRRGIIAISRDFQANHFMLSTCDNMTIDAVTSGNVARYINHSCDPNAIAVSRRIFVKRQNEESLYEARSFIKAIRDIGPDEEITFNYRMDDDKSLPSCACGAKNCTGVISMNVQKQLDEDDESSEDEEFERKPREKHNCSEIEQPPKKLAKRRQTHIGICSDELDTSLSSRRSMRVRAAGLKMEEGEHDDKKPEEKTKWKYIECVGIGRQQQAIQEAESKKRLEKINRLFSPALMEEWKLEYSNKFNLRTSVSEVKEEMHTEDSSELKVKTEEVSRTPKREIEDETFIADVEKIRPQLEDAFLMSSGPLLPSDLL